MPPKSAVLLPLYIYPLLGAWDPLYEAISGNPSLKFTIILNPHNGPGIPPSPDANYAREIPRLNAYPNVRTVGYVRINYCKRPLAEVCQDVVKYAGWAKDYDNSGLGVHGIFLDETPNHFSAKAASYLNTVDQNVKETWGLLGDRLVIHNPGTIPDVGFANPGPDVTTVLEESYAQYQLRHLKLQGQLSSLRYSRSRCSYMVHSTPQSAVKQLVQELRHRGEYLFITELCENYYVRFGSSWGDFIEAMQMEDH